MSDEITVEFLHEIFEYDALTGKVTWKTRTLDHTHWEVGPAKTFNATMAGKEAGSARKGDNRGIETKIPTPSGSKARPLHRVIWAMVTGEWPDKNEDITHIDGDKKNNRLDNLTNASKAKSQHKAKTRSDNTSGETGIVQDPETGKWKWRVMVDGVNQYGTSNTLKEAQDNRKSIIDNTEKVDD